MSKQMPEHILMEKFKRGEEKALAHFYKLHFRALCYFAERLTNNQQEAEDIAAETFAKLWKLRENFDSSTNVKAFLYISVRNACLNYIKYIKRQNEAQKEMLYLASESEEKEASSYEIEATVLHNIYEEVESLPRQCKKIFKMIFFEGMSTAQIAEALNLSPNTVLNQKARAYKLLKVRLLKRRLLEIILFSPIPAGCLHLAKYLKIMWHQINIFF